MSERKREDLPIGYWLRRADELLTARIDAAQSEHGLTRLGWQALNVIRDSTDADRQRVTETLAPFASAGEIAVLVEELLGRGLLSEDGGCVRLTDSGSRLYERALAVQQTIRSRAFEGIERHEYAIVVDVLRRLVENLERSVPDAVSPD